MHLRTIITLLGSYWLELFGFCGILWAGWRLWKTKLRNWWSDWKARQVNRRNREAAEEMRRHIHNGWSRYTSIWFCFVIALVVGIGYFLEKPDPIISYDCPDECLGVVKVEGPNEIETVNLKTQRHREWRFRASPPVTPKAIFPGYVIELQFVEKGGHEDFVFFHAIRGKQWGKGEIYDAVTYFDGPDRPVLAKNCKNTPDDKATVCEGGVAQFAQELSQR
jgi:hypothetical protein